MTIRQTLGSLASRVYPGLDERIYNRRRDREVQDFVAEHRYKERLADLTALAPLPAQAHLVVVPQIGPDSQTFRPASGNFFYEIAQSAREYFGADRVSIFGVDGDLSQPEWHEQLIRYLISSGATHVIAQVEGDPNSSEAKQSWDILWSQLHPRWNGVFLGLVTDSYFTWITAGARRLAKMSSNFMLVDICMPMDDVLVAGRAEVGPVNMPISNESLTVIDAACEGLERIFDVSFIGALYPYRQELLAKMSSSGATVAINPHREVAANDFESSRKNLPSYLDYMKALRQSRMTINFSQSNAGNQQQLKTRVLEAACMGSLVLTDDVARTELFWSVGSEYAYFEAPDLLPELVGSLLADSNDLEAVRLAGQQRARAINISSFWDGIEEGLARRGLRSIAD